MILLSGWKRTASKTLSRGEEDSTDAHGSGNRWYDQALSEMVLEDLDFNHGKDWWCVEGGAQEVAHRMRKKIERKDCISFQKKVMGVSYAEDQAVVDVTIKGERWPRRYDAVFNSAPLGAMQRMDLSGLNLNWGTEQAIRSLGYGASCEVGIRFKNLWWIKSLGIHQGGVAKTDLPPRVCVYPSYNCHHDVEKPGVLLCSYTSSQEAQRLGSLISRKSPEDEEEPKTLLIDNLAKLHSKTNEPRRLHRCLSTHLRRLRDAPCVRLVRRSGHHRRIRLLRPRPVPHHVPIHHPYQQQAHHNQENHIGPSRPGRRRLGTRPSSPLPIPLQALAQQQRPPTRPCNCITAARSRARMARSLPSTIAWRTYSSCLPRREKLLILATTRLWRLRANGQGSRLSLRAFGWSNGATSLNLRILKRPR